MKKNIRNISLLFSIICFFMISRPVDAAQDLPIKSITGTTFQDMNANGSFDVKDIELPIKNVTVSLFKTKEDAQKNTNIISKKKTNLSGIYTFSKLKNGEYYIKYSLERSNYKQSKIDNTEFDGSGIIPLTISGAQTIYTKNLPFNRLSDLLINPFADHNQNGLQESDEELLDGKTMIILNLKKLSNIINNGELTNINVEQLVVSALKDGNVDLTDGIYLRTSAKGKGIEMPSIDNGIYLILRSPFNLTIKDSLENSDRIKAIIDIMSSGDINSILTNSNLLNTGDITTNNDNTYIKSLFTIFPKIYDFSSKIDFNLILGEDQSQSVTNTLDNLLNLNNELANNLPAFRIAVVNYFGRIYDVTGLKVKKTSVFPFGIKDYASFEGNVFSDLDADGKMGKLELSGTDSRLIVYNELGEELAFTNTKVSQQKFKLDKLPYDTQLYLAIETDQPVYPTIEQSQLPDPLKGKKIITQASFSAFAKETKITQNIGVLSSGTNSVSLILGALNLEQNTQKVTFKNTDKLNDISVFFTVNNQTPENVTLKKAPLFGSARTTEVTLPVTSPVGENRLDVSWKKGVYTVNLDSVFY